MIAHKRLKLFGAVLLAVVLTVSMAVPVFASSPLPTDENGNWVPSSYYVLWQIYNTETQSYDNVNVTSSLSVDGLTFTFPYNAYGVTRVQMNLYTGLSSNIYISGVSFSGYANYLGSQTIDSFTSNCNFTRYYLNQNGVNSSVSSSFGTSNPFSFSQSFDTGAPFTRCLFTFYTNVVSGVLTIHFDSLLIGGQDISSMITVQNLDNASQDLTDLGEQLEVPKPTIQVANIVEDALDGVDYQSVGSTTWSFMSNDLITKMLLITVSFALLGYILFGKKESGSK